MSSPQSGIYEIRNIVTGKRYVGITKDFTSRWYSHKSLLRLNEHHSIYLQRSWNAHSEKNFTFQVIRRCEKRCAHCLEQILLFLHRDNLYNVWYTGFGRTTDFENTPDHTRVKMSKSAKIRSQTPESQERCKKSFAKGRTPEAIARRIETQRRQRQDPVIMSSINQKARETRSQKYTPEEISLSAGKGKTYEPRKYLERLAQNLATRRKRKTPQKFILSLDVVMIAAMDLLDQGLSLESFDWLHLINYAERRHT